MKFSAAKISRLLFVVFAAAYPFALFYFLAVRKTSARAVSLAVIAFGLAALFAFKGGTLSADNPRHTDADDSVPPRAPNPAGFSLPPNKGAFAAFVPLIAGIACLATGSAAALKLYPVLVNAVFFCAFAPTLFFPPSAVYRLACLMDKTIPASLAAGRVEGYCKKVTAVWCAFFVLNGGNAALLAFCASDLAWSLYAGAISYILMGLLFAVEFIVRKRVQKKMPCAVPLSQVKTDSREASAIVCYDGAYSDGVYKTWGDFIAETAALRGIIAENDAGGKGGRTWLLHCEDCWHFLTAFAALLQSKKEIILSANISELYLAEMRGGGKYVPFLTDKENLDDSLSIPTLLKENSINRCPQINADEEVPVFNPDETSMIMYTSGSTGKPKAVRQRMTEFETDNRFVLSKWGDEFLKRKVCSTVSQHHIYGLLFSVMLPFTAGVPFRRKRIDYPEEFEKLCDDSYMIVTVPAFLKRATDAPLNLNLKTPCIFTSGGVLPYDTAEKTEKVFGFWPIEVYGSTETSGIAYRQSVNGPEWTPFDNAHISLTSDGCLCIRSPYIKAPEGFETADLAEILPDGRFILKGRIDSVVKIEEKRVSLAEVEARLLESGLVSEVCVIPMEDRRQYLVAAIALNAAGLKFFGIKIFFAENKAAKPMEAEAARKRKIAMNDFFREYLAKFFEPVVIPKKWRFLDALPLDSQGKKKRDVIRALFETSDAPAGFASLENAAVLAKSETAAEVSFAVPASSPYFDGHFPGFSILPAVAQTEIVLRFADKFFGTGIAAREIKKMKFSSPVRPGDEVKLFLEKTDAGIVFKMASAADEKIIFSQGTINL